MQEGAMQSAFTAAQPHRWFLHGVYG